MCTSLDKQSPLHLSNHSWTIKEVYGVHSCFSRHQRLAKWRNIFYWGGESSQIYSFSNFVLINNFYSSNDDYTSSVDSNIEENFGYLDLGILTCDPILGPCISSPPIEVTSTISLDDICVDTILASYDSVQYDIDYLQDISPSDDYLTDIACLFVESYLANFKDTINGIHFLFDEDDPSSVVGDHFNALLHSLHDHSLEIDVIVDTYVQHLGEVSLSLEETLESFDLVLHSSSLDLALSFSTIWPNTPDLEGQLLALTWENLSTFQILHTS